MYGLAIRLLISGHLILLSTKPINLRSIELSTHVPDPKCLEVTVMVVNSYPK